MMSALLDAMCKAWNEGRREVSDVGTREGVAKATTTTTPVLCCTALFLFAARAHTCTRESLRHSVFFGLIAA
jgi:hypothetical protein